MWLCEHTILFTVEIIYCLIKIIRYTFFAGWGGGEVKSQWLANNNSITATINLSSVWAFSDSYQLKIVEPQEHSSLSLKRIVFLNSKNFSWYAGNLYYCWATNLQWSARYNFFRWVIAFDPIFFCGSITGRMREYSDQPPSLQLCFLRLIIYCLPMEKTFHVQLK